MYTLYLPLRLRSFKGRSWSNFFLQISRLTNNPKTNRAWLESTFIYAFLATIVVFSSHVPVVLGQSQNVSPYVIEIVAKTGMQFDDEGPIENLGWGPSINDSGKVAFTGRIRVHELGPDTAKEGVFVWDGNTLERRSRLVNGFYYNNVAQINYLDTAFEFSDVVQINNQDQVVWHAKSHDGLFAFILRLGAAGDFKIIAKKYYFRIDNAALTAESPFADLQPWVTLGDTVNNQSRVVFSGILKENPAATVLSTPVNTETGGHDSAQDFHFSAPISGFPGFFPMVTDDGKTIVRGGETPTAPLTLFVDPTLKAAMFVAATNIPEAISNEFNAIGRLPGISDDGRLIAFVANHKTQGVGIFVSALKQLSDTTATYTVPIKIAGGEFGLSAFDLESRVGVNHWIGSSSNNFTVVFLAKRGLGGPSASDPLGLYTVHVDLSEPSSPKSAKPMRVIEVSQTISNLPGEIESIKLYDPVNNNGAIVFWVKTLVGSQAIICAKIPTFMLTFDDGPKAESTPYILEQLKRIKKTDGTPVKAGFFLLGKDKTLALWWDIWRCILGVFLCPDPGVESNPKIVQKIYEEGHFIGIHTQHHPDLAGLSPDNVEKEILECYNTINDVGVTPAKRFRSPYLRDPLIPSDSPLQAEWKKIRGDLVGDAIPFISEDSVISNCKKKIEQAPKFPVCLIFHDFRGLPGHRFNFVNIVDKLVEEGYQVVDFDPDLVSEKLDKVSSNTQPGKEILVILPTYNTVRFCEVTSGGNTDTRIVESGPSLSPGYIPLDNFYDVTTTASYRGQATVTFGYNDSGLSTEQEENLKLMHSEDSIWTDVTTSVDIINNMITGQVNTLSIFVIAIPYVVNMKLDAGWSMISLPVVPESLVLSDVFPGAEVVYGYERNVGYVRVHEDQELEVGKGYWILLNEERTYTLTGEPIQDFSYSVEDGWYMIGGCSSPAQKMVTSGSIDVIYGYAQGKGYTRLLGSGSLERGKGYWILFSNTSEGAVFTASSPVSA